jgi:hypothetical protein
MTPLRAKLWNPDNAKPDLGQVHGIDIRTGERRHRNSEPGMARPEPEEAVQKDEPPPAPPPAPPSVIPINVYPVAFATHDRIIKTVCRIFDISLNEVMSERRNLRAVEARQTAMALTVRLTKHSMPKVGFIFDRDHTTVLHAVKKMQPVLDAVEAHMPPESITEWVTAIREKLASNEWIQARRARRRNNDRTQATHCIHGHPYDKENTGYRPEGRRFCKICRDKNRLRYEAKKPARLEA